MLNLFQQQGVFFDLFERLAAHVVAAAEQLRAVGQTYPHSDGAIQKIREEEHRADEITHEILARLDSNFQTPIDREDIHGLAGDLDTIVDDIDALVKRLPLFHVEKIEPPFMRQADVLLEAVGDIRTAVSHLRHQHHLSEMMPQLLEIHRLENVGDDNHHAALSELFGGGHDIMFVIKWKELYDLLEAAIDGCEDTANTLRRIALRNQ